MWPADTSKSSLRMCQSRSRSASRSPQSVALSTVVSSAPWQRRLAQAGRLEVRSQPSGRDRSLHFHGRGRRALLRSSVDNPTRACTPFEVSEPKILSKSKARYGTGVRYHSLRQLTLKNIANFSFSIPGRDVSGAELALHANEMARIDPLVEVEPRACRRIGYCGERIEQPARSECWQPELSNSRSVDVGRSDGLAKHCADTSG